MGRPTENPSNGYSTPEEHTNKRPFLRVNVVQPPPWKPTGQFIACNYGSSLPPPHPSSPYQRLSLVHASSGIGCPCITTISVVHPSPSNIGCSTITIKYRLFNHRHRISVVQPSLSYRLLVHHNHDTDGPPTTIQGRLSSLSYRLSIHHHYIGGPAITARAMRVRERDSQTPNRIKLLCWPFFFYAVSHP